MIGINFFKFRIVFQMTKNIVKFFHVVIIATFLLCFSGCGYKGDPVYLDKSSKATTK